MGGKLKKIYILLLFFFTPCLQYHLLCGLMDGPVRQWCRQFIYSGHRCQAHTVPRVLLFTQSRWLEHGHSSSRPPRFSHSATASPKTISLCLSLYISLAMYINLALTILPKGSLRNFIQLKGMKLFYNLTSLSQLKEREREEKRREKRGRGVRE